jgi:hypothetical protein
MALAKDEIIGLAIAVVVGGAALATYVYRQGKAAATAPAPAAPEAEDPQVARGDFADDLTSAFGADHAAGKATADGTTLQIQWEDCSKPMLHRLLREEQNYQTLNIREVSGLTLARLKALGFKKVVCADLAGKQVTDDLR